MFAKKQSHYFLIIPCLIIFIICIFIINYYKSTNNKDITAAANQYVTTGFFNKNRLLKIDKYKLVFSDSNNAILEVQGMEYKAPHETIVLKLTMSKNKHGFWYVKKAEALNNFNIDESAD